MKYDDLNKALISFDAARRDLEAATKRLLELGVEDPPAVALDVAEKSISRKPTWEMVKIAERLLRESGFRIPDQHVQNALIAALAAAPLTALPGPTDQDALDMLNAVGHLNANPSERDIAAMKALLAAFRERLLKRKDGPVVRRIDAGPETASKASALAGTGTFVVPFPRPSRMDAWWLLQKIHGQGGATIHGDWVLSVLEEFWAKKRDEALLAEEAAAEPADPAPATPGFTAGDRVRVKPNLYAEGQVGTVVRIVPDDMYCVMIRFDDKRIGTLNYRPDTIELVERPAAPAQMPIVVPPVEHDAAWVAIARRLWGDDYSTVVPEVVGRAFRKAMEDALAAAPLKKDVMRRIWMPGEPTDEMVKAAVCMLRMTRDATGEEYTEMRMALNAALAAAPRAEPTVPDVTVDDMECVVRIWAESLGNAADAYALAAREVGDRLRKRAAKSGAVSPPAPAAPKLAETPAWPTEPTDEMVQAMRRLYAETLPRERPEDGEFCRMLLRAAGAVAPRPRMGRNTCGNCRGTGETHRIEGDHHAAYQVDEKCMACSGEGLIPAVVAEIPMPTMMDCEEFWHAHRTTAANEHDQTRAGLMKVRELWQGRMEG